MPPDGTQPVGPEGRPASSRRSAPFHGSSPAGRAPSGPPPDDPDGETRLAARDQARIDGAVVTVARRGRGPALVAALVAGAFLLGLVRPWDWLDGGRDGASATAREGPPAGEPAEVAGPGGDPAAIPATGTARGPAGTDGALAYQAPTCAYPASWRTASLQLWAGRQARVWTAAEAVAAAGPTDPSIRFHPIASTTVDAIGWCAPVTGPERPPLDAGGTLYRLANGVATALPVERLEPAAASALGELWAPVPGTDGRQRPWQPGRYVIRIATGSGSYVRYLGLEVGVVERTPGRTAVPSGSPAPGAAPTAP